MTFIGFLAIALWGTLALLGYYTKEVPPFQLLFMCFLISAALLLVKRLILNTPLLARPSLNKREWVVGVTGLFGFHFCYFMSLKYASALNVSLIAYLWPMFLALMLANKTQRLRATVGSAIGFTGVSCLLLQEQSLVIKSTELIGYGFAFVCALIWSTYSYLISKTTNQVDDIGWLSLAVAAFSLLAHLLFESPQTQFDIVTLTAILLLGLGPVGGAFYLWELGMKRGNAKVLASLSYTSPLLSSLLLILFGLASWSNSIVIALFLIILGGLVASYKSTPNS